MIVIRPLRHALPPRVRAAGMTLIELMIASAITLFMVIALGALFTNNSIARREIDSSGQQIENGRYAMELIRSDVRLAGYYGEFVPPWDGVAWQLPTNPCASTNLGWNATGTQVPVPISGYEGHDTAIASLSCLTNRVAETDVLIVRRTSTHAVAPGSAASGVPALQVSLQSRDCATPEDAFVLANGGSSSFTLHGKDCTTLSLVRQYMVHIYYVASCDDCTANDGIPTLKRVELAAGGVTEPISLVQGISDFRVEYGLDTIKDGAPNTYVKCGADATYGGPCAAADWANVMVVKVFLLTRNTEPTPGYTDTKTYAMGLSGSVSARTAERAYRHHAYSTPIRVVGQSGFREMQ